MSNPNQKIPSLIKIDLPNPCYGIGMMSGTSLDGIDMALVKITKDYANYQYQLEQFLSVPYQAFLQDEIFKQSNNQTSTVQGICSLNKQIGLAYCEALEQFIKQNQVDLDQVSFIASHGQTIWHNPDNLDQYYSSTLQIGDHSQIAYQFNKIVIYDFRSLDMAADGVGAPLVPMSEVLLYRNSETPQILVNIGGISNLTYLPINCQIDQVIAFDTGPGNMLIDLACRKFYQINYDHNGMIASQYQSDDSLMAYLKNDRYLTKPYPKATGRETYGQNRFNQILDYAQTLNLTGGQIIRTLTEFSAELIIDQIKDFFPHFNGNIIISGGGANNLVLIIHFNKYLKKQLPKANLLTIDQLGISPDAKEAMAFAILGHLRLINHPGNVIKVTKAKDYLCLGSIILPPRL